MSDRIGRKKTKANITPSKDNLHERYKKIPPSVSATPSSHSISFSRDGVSSVAAAAASAASSPQNDVTFS